MIKLTIEVDDDDVQRLDGLMERWGFTSREVAASTALQLALPAIEQAESMGTQQSGSDGAG